MSFHVSAENIRVDDGHILRPQLRNENGDLNDAEIDLNNCLGNDDGRFDWSGGGFSNSAENIHFSIEGGDNVPILRARLFNIAGEALDADCNLSERIGNDNGNFVFN
ncbi:cyanovirin-n family protein [Colletotrichum kahawae]|uniref:Cyanovirin-n family protein n=1 Tax=Colletotrichum kahawae TaxID=34407 RepID=A0AAD9Y198_COLKA|nr:cyanovirin-n family protein [Colletotrichum kahawae]